MKYKLLIVLVILMLALLVSASVPVNLTWGAPSASDPAAMTVPFPGFVDSPPPVGPTPVTPDTPILNPLATISQSLVNDLDPPK